MRRTAFVPFVIASLLAAGVAEAQTPKIGFINSQEILAAAPGAKEAEAEYQKDLQSYQDQVQQLQSELQKMQQQLDQQQLTLSPEAKKNRQQEIQQKQQEYQQKYQDLQDQANRRRQELIQPIMDKVSGIIEKMRQEGHYSLILDVAAGSIIAADSTLDLTQEVIRRLKTAPDSTASAGGGTGGIR